MLPTQISPSVFRRKRKEEPWQRVDHDQQEDKIRVSEEHRSHADDPEPGRQRRHNAVAVEKSDGASVRLR
jgi:hypothetical protein